MLITLVIFIAVLFVLVMVHEAGHFFASRKFGVKVDEFGFGIPPRLFGWRKRVDGTREFIVGSKQVSPEHNTLFSLNWLPIGGFVKIKGENEENPDPDSFSAQVAWKRVVILVSGVVGNIVLAFIIFTLIFSIGSEMYIPEGVSLKGAVVANEAIKIISVAKDSPASGVGITAGDTLGSLDGQEFQDISAVRDYIQAHADRSLRLVVSRNGEVLKLDIKPKILSQIDGKPILGIAMVKSAVVRYPPYLAVVKGFETTAVSLVAVVRAIGGIIANLIQGQKVGVDVAGPVGIAMMTGQAAKFGFLYILQFIALLSLNLAIINIVPFPALDGGRVLFVLIEKIRGRRVKSSVEQLVNTAGFAIFLILILLVTIGDVRKLEIVTRVVDGVKNMF